MCKGWLVGWLRGISGHAVRRTQTINVDKISVNVH